MTGGFPPLVGEHFLMMEAAVGGGDCIAAGEHLSDFENATGMGEVYVWFDRGDQGRSGAGDDIAGVTDGDSASRERVEARS